MVKLYEYGRECDRMIREVRVETLEDLMPLLSEQDFRPELHRMLL